MWGMAASAEDIPGFFMDPGFFQDFFGGGCRKITEKHAESDDMDQLMGGDIQGEGEKPNIGRLDQDPDDFVILKADFIKIIAGGSQGLIAFVPFIPDDLGEGA